MSDYYTPDPIDLVLSSVPPCTDEDEATARQRDVIESNRVKLVQYVHDITLLFPHMKEKMVFSVDDCDIIKNEVTTSGKVDKFLDILLTKGPRAIGIFHAALRPQYPHLFDYLSRLFTSAGIELPPDRRLTESDEEERQQHLASPVIKGLTANIPLPSEVYSFHHHGSKTIRKSLDILSKHCNTMQKERDDLHKALVKKEEEISNLLSSREYFQSNLLAVTQKYQQLLEELVNWKDYVSNQSDHSYQKMLREQQSIQTEYDDLEASYRLNLSELSAARDRIMQLLTHVERAENVMSILQEEREELSDKVTKLETEVSHLLSAQEREEGARQTTPSDITYDTVLLGLQADLKKAQRDCSCLQEQLRVVSLERKGALDERDTLVSQLYKEKEENKKLQKDVEMLKVTMEDTQPAEPLDQTTVTMATEDAAGLAVSLGLIVRSIPTSAANRVKVGDEIIQINSIKLNAADVSTVEFAQRLIHCFTPTVVLTIQRPSPLQTKYPDIITTLTSPLTQRSPGHLNSLFPSSSLPCHHKYSISTPTSPLEDRRNDFFSDLPLISVGSETSKPLRSISYDNSSSIPSFNWSEDIPISCATQGLLGSKSSWAFQSMEKDDMDMGPDHLGDLGDHGRLGDLGNHDYLGDLGDHGRLGDHDGTNNLDDNSSQGGSYNYPRPGNRGRRKAFHRRDKAKLKVRHSRSLETVFKLHDIQDFGPPSNLQDTGNKGSKVQRSVVLSGGFFDTGHRVVGGRGNDVFVVCESTRNSCPLKTGDQLMKIQSRTVAGMTRATILDTLKLHSMKSEMTLLVASNIEGYEKLSSQNYKDRFYVRANSRSRSYGPQMLAFQKGDVLLVTDTCPEGRPGYWYAMKVTSDGHATEGGYISIELTQAGLQEIEGQQKYQTLKTKTRTSVENFKQDVFKYYQPVSLVKATFPRPVILLGSLEMEVRRCLVDLGSSGNLKFSYCPKRTSMSPLSSLELEDKVEIIEGEGHVSYSTCDAVEELMNKGYHCILSVSPEQLSRQQVTKFKPMVLLLECKGIKTVKSIMSSANIPLGKEGVHLERAKELRAQYSTLFTSSIQLPSTMGLALLSVCKAINAHQNDVMWEDCPYDPFMVI